MSQDLFDDDDFETDFRVRPEVVEFSGISSGTSSSPGSQATTTTAIPVPVVSAAPSPTPKSAPQSYVCPAPSCKKRQPYKTERGYKNHMSTVHPDLQTELAVPQPTLPTTVLAASQASTAEVFICVDCNSTLKTKAGYIRHRAAHKMKDALKRMPSVSEFMNSEFQDMVRGIVLEVQSEPSGGSLKELFLRELIESGFGDVKWLDLTAQLGTFIAETVLQKQVKVLPANQYEEMLVKLNRYLNQNIEELGSKLRHICEAGISNSLARRLIFRMASRLMQETQKWAMQKIRPTIIEEGLILNEEMTESEERAFLFEIGGFIRHVFEKSRKDQTEKQMKCQCIKEKFVDGQHPISKSQFLNKSNWFSGEEECIEPSFHAATFFKIIELEIMPATVNTFSIEEVVENVLAHQQLLDHWYHLTCDHFPEEKSLLFMRYILSAYCKFSIQFEEKRKNR